MEYQIKVDDQRLVVYDNQKRYEIDLRERLLDFVVDTMKYLATIPYKKEYDVFRIQLYPLLLRSAWEHNNIEKTPLFLG